MISDKENNFLIEMANNSLAGCSLGCTFGKKKKCCKKYKKNKQCKKCPKKG